MRNRFKPVAKLLRAATTKRPHRTFSSTSQPTYKSTSEKSSYTTIQKLLLGSIVAAGTASLITAADNATKEPTIGDSMVNHPGSANPWIIPDSECELSSSKTNDGRSGGHKVERLNEETGSREYFYYKETFTRADLVRELVVGSLGKELFGDQYPDVFIHEKPLAGQANKAQFSFLSQSVDPTIPHSNLQSWALLYHDDHESREYGPKHIAVCVAFDMLVGKSDCKLANIVGIWASAGHCYSVDHESAFRKATSFVTTATEVIESIGEYTPKSIVEYGHEANCPELNTNDDPDRPLRDRPEIKQEIYPLLYTAIEQEISNGDVARFYQRFASLSEERIQQAVNKFNFLTPAESKFHIEKIKEAQSKTREFIAEHYAAPDETRKTGFQWKP